MQRRTFLISAAVLGVATVAGGATWLATCEAPVHPGLTIDKALAKLRELKKQPVAFTGAWNAAQVFNHCAQSVEMSMTGYPEHRSQIFKMSVGRAAFAVFSQQGEMQHSLDEAIPGAPLLAADDDTTMAITRLEVALTTFKKYRGELQPHFAYGYLNKREYALAHVMHLNNHLEELQS